MNKMFYTMIGNETKLLTSMNLLIDKAKQTISNTHREPLSNTHSFTELHEIINRLIDRIKDKSYAKRILNIAQQLNINGFYSDTDNCIHFDDIGKLQITKSKLVMIFYNKMDNAEKCYWNPVFESIKNDNFHIQLSDDSKKWIIIESRFS